MTRLLFAALWLLLLSAPAAAQDDMDYFRGGGMQQQDAPAPDRSGEKRGQSGLDAGEEEYSGFGMKTSVVTPLEECLRQLPPDEAMEVRTRYTQPYAECRGRLAGKASEKRHLQVTKEKDAATPETPRNFVRVQKGQQDKAQDAPEGKDGGSLPFGIKPDNSTANYNR